MRLIDADMLIKHFEIIRNCWMHERTKNMRIDYSKEHIPFAI